MGNRKRIILASESRLEVVAELAPRFFTEVLGFDYEDCLVTDESDLHDFANATTDPTSTVEAMLDRLEAHYLIDARNGSTRIVDLLEFLQERGVTG